jgi:hypothetical protein
MDIQHKQYEKNGSFFVESEGKKLAKLSYSSEKPGVIVIEHTIVDPSLRGKNIGLQLVNKAVDFARENKVKIIAECPFAKTVFERHPDEYNDVLYK